MWDFVKKIHVFVFLARTLTSKYKLYSHNESNKGELPQEPSPNKINISSQHKREARCSTNASAYMYACVLGCHSPLSAQCFNAGSELYAACRECLLPS